MATKRANPVARNNVMPLSPRVLLQLWDKELRRLMVAAATNRAPVRVLICPRRAIGTTSARGSRMRRERSLLVFDADIGVYKHRRLWFDLLRYQLYVLLCGYLGIA